jgi:3-hydroxybutyryl-CoA dehydrogenase
MRVMAMTTKVSTVAVVGGGLMGSGIAETALMAGLSVIVREIPEGVDRTRGRLTRAVDTAMKRGKLDAAERDDALRRLTVTSDLEDIAGADLVIEAVPEIVDLKLSLLTTIHGIVSDDAIIASNTSSIPIAQLASVVTPRERVVGLHFFSPVPVMPVVEIVRALDTGEETVESARAFVHQLGKQPIVTKDRSGFIVNMLLTPYLVGAVRMYEEGFASREDIDRGMKGGAGHPMGPLELCDFIGLDVIYAVCNSLYDEFKREEYAPPPLIKRMIASGRLGRKSGRGFYEYGGGSSNGK